MNDNSEKFRKQAKAANVLERDLVELKQLGDAVMSGEWKGHAPRTLSASERTSLAALVSYVAHTRGISEDEVRRGFYERFGVTALEALAPAHYDDAVRFLVDQVPE